MSDHEKVDVLAFGAHPDDVELFCGGTICLFVSQKYRVGIVDLTRGELGSRGSVELRSEEAENARQLSGVAERINLGIPDGDIQNTFDNRLKIIRAIRRYRPTLLLTNAPECRHPDHGAAAEIIKDCVFYSGLRKIQSYDGGVAQEEWRPKRVLQYVQAIPFEPTLVVDVTSVWDQRIETVRAFRSQFHHEDYQGSDGEPETFISNPAFFKTIEARARMQGQRIGAEFGEGFRSLNGPVAVTDLSSLV